VERCVIWSRDVDLEEEKLLAFEMWVWRRLEMVRWTESETNEKVFGMMG
jgi:hypothetical protein